MGYFNIIMKTIIKILSLSIAALIALTVLPSCSKDNGTSNDYHFEYTDVSFDSSKEYSIAPETRFNTLKTQLESMVKVASVESSIISMAEGQITPSNYKGINATITLKKGSVTIKEWKLEAKNMWEVVPA